MPTEDEIRSRINSIVPGETHVATLEQLEQASEVIRDMTEKMDEIQARQKAIGVNARKLNSAATRKASDPPTRRPADLEPERARTVADLLKMAAEPTRLRILAMLSRREMSVTDICAAVERQSQPAVSHHLALLRASGMATFTRSGRNNLYAASERGRRLAYAAWCLAQE